MSEITPKYVADVLADADNELDDETGCWLSISTEDAVLHIKATSVSDRDNPVHFRAVVVEGDETPIVLERPAELGLSWHDGGDLLALTRDGITLFPNGADEWSMSPDNARELAAHLAAMADAREAAQAEERAQ